MTMQWRSLLLQGKSGRGAGSCILAVVLLVCAGGQARTVHVSQRELAGIDAGSQERTLGAALAGLRAGDAVVIHGGVYREEVSFERSGSAEAPISIEAAEGEYVVVTGADRLTDWDKAADEDGVFSTSWPHRFVGWNEHFTHPGDDYHRLIGRCEQVFIDAYPLRQVLQRDKLSRGTFYVDLDARRLSSSPPTAGTSPAEK